MKIAHREIIIECYKKHTIAKQAFLAWIAEVLDADWKTSMDVKNRYPSADFLSDNRVVFNIKGKKYRLIVKINYPYSTVNVRFAGTHAEYDKIDAETI
jgi:mRNA interferase HigB